MVEPDRPQMAVRRTRIACWAPKRTNTHSEYVIRIALHGNGVCMNASQCYVISALLFPLNFLGGEGGGCCKCCTGASVLSGLQTVTHRKW
jgi:hypothetical protein